MQINLTVNPSKSMCNSGLHSSVTASKCEFVTESRCEPAMNKCEPVSHIKLLSADEEKGIGESDINQPTAVECE